MTNFAAKEKNAPSTNLQANDGPPKCAQEFLPNRLDGVWGIEFWYKTPKGHTVADLLRPGYFDSMRETFTQQLRNGEAFVNALVGSREDGWTEVRLHVLEAPFNRESPVLMAKGPSYNFTPVRHSEGTDGVDRSKGGKAA